MHSALTATMYVAHCQPTWLNAAANDAVAIVLSVSPGTISTSVAAMSV